MGSTRTITTSSRIVRSARNITVAMANSVATIVVSLVAMPFYLRFLGIEAYGLIGFYATLQAVSQVLDLGLASTMSREVARSGADERTAGRLLHTLGIVYAVVGATMALVGLVVAPWLARHWLEPGHIPVATVAHAVALMGFNLACRWPISLYHSALAGAERLALSSAVSMSVNTSAALASILVLAVVSPSIQAFFVVQAGAGLLHALVLRHLAYREVGCGDMRFDISELRRVWRFSAGMGGIAITSLAFTQLDKVLLSNLLALEEFGRYMLAVLVVSGLQAFVSPTFSTIYPRFSKLVASGELEELTRTYALGSRLLAAVLFPAALTLAFHARDLVALWTGNAAVAMQVAPLVAILSMGSALNGMMHFPYALQIAHGDTRLPLRINLVLLILLAPLTVALALSHGALGGAWSWAIVGLVYAVFGTLLTGRRILASAGMGWLMRDVGVPLVLSAAIVGGGAWTSCEFGMSILPRLAIASVAAFIAMLASVLAFASSRHAVGELLRGHARLFQA